MPRYLFSVSFAAIGFLIGVAALSGQLDLIALGTGVLDRMEGLHSTEAVTLLLLAGTGLVIDRSLAARRARHAAAIAA